MKVQVRFCQKREVRVKKGHGLGNYSENIHDSFVKTRILVYRYQEMIFRFLTQLRISKLIRLLYLIIIYWMLFNKLIEF